MFIFISGSDVHLHDGGLLVFPFTIRMKLFIPRQPVSAGHAERRRGRRLKGFGIDLHYRE
jgi:hypothetical protein